MGYSIIEIDGVEVSPISKRFPVEIQVMPHALNDITVHFGILDDNQIPLAIMRTTQHQLDPHTMIIDGRDVSADGDKLDTIESGAQVNNLTDSQAASLTCGGNTNWHNHDSRYYTQTQLSTSGQSSVSWGNVKSTPSTYPPSPHTHPNDITIGGPYYTQLELQTSGQAQVDWTNVTNKPTFSGNNWLPPAKNMSENLPPNGSGYLVGDRSIWKVNDHIYSWNGSSWSDVYTPVLNDTIMVSDDGDGKPAQYWHNGTDWIKIADPDYADHGSLSGLVDDDHLQYLTLNRHNNILGNPHFTTITQTIAEDSVATFSTLNLNTITNGSDTNLHNHDNRYYTESEINTSLNLYYTKLQLDSGQLDNRYYTETELNNGQLDNRYFTESEITNGYYSKIQLDAGQLDNRYYTENELSGINGASLIGTSGMIETNVQDVLISLNNTVGAITVTLDAAYQNGKTINALSGPVKIDIGASLYSPIELTNKTNAPSDGLAAGQLAVINNILYIYDGSRSKWLSPSKVLTFGKSGNNDGNVLRITGEISDNGGGYKMSRPGTITSLTIHSSVGGNDKDIDIRINSFVVFTITTDISGNYLSTTLNIDYNAGDSLSMKVQAGGGGIQNTSAVLEFCHRA